MAQEFAPHQMIGAASGGFIGYMLLRQVGFVLEEASYQGLEVWLDAQRGWMWRWRTTDLVAERGFCGLGEAFVDALIARYPAIFVAIPPADPQ